jgi:branched-subunit amino acid aminotransferase/4-amino-4-deoxychorismate lyase
MSTIAYLNGVFVPSSQAVLPVTDWGFVQGVTLAEQLRTFRGEVFLPERHLDRLWDGICLLGWQGLVDRGTVASALQQVVEQNRTTIDRDDDLGVTVFVTPGTYPTYRVGGEPPVHVGVHSYSLPFRLWCRQYEQGQALVTVGVRQVPEECWPTRLKCRSRMHYYLASLAADSRRPGATPLLLNSQGHVSETPTSNVVAYFGQGGLIAPLESEMLPGVSLGFVKELASELGIPFSHRALLADELYRADEILVTSTPYCVLPVLEIDGHRLLGPGPVFRRLLAAWSERVSVRIADQACKFADRNA